MNWLATSPWRLCEVYYVVLWIRLCDNGTMRPGQFLTIYRPDRCQASGMRDGTKAKKKRRTDRNTFPLLSRTRRIDDKGRGWMGGSGRGGGGEIGQ
jgi:hypothetical protein